MSQWRIQFKIATLIFFKLMSVFWEIEINVLQKKKLKAFFESVYRHYIPVAF